MENNMKKTIYTKLSHFAVENYCNIVNQLYFNLKKNLVFYKTIFSKCGTRIMTFSNMWID